MKYTYALAQNEDDAAIRRLLASIPMEGEISVAFEREPCYFYGSAVEGEKNELISVKLQDGDLVAMASRSVSSAYLNGEPQQIGYLSQLRLSPAHRDMQILVRGHRFLRELETTEQLPIQLCTIISDNHAAIKVLTSGKLGLPTYQRYGRLCTLAVQLRRKKLIKHADVEIVKGDRGVRDEIVACLQTNGRLKQFYPFYTTEQIESTERSRDLTWENFYVAKRGNRVIGICAVWDQSGFKQTVVKGYSATIRRFRPLYNLGASLFRYAPLPPLNHPFSYFYLSHIAIEGNDPGIFSALVNRVYNDYLSAGYAYFMVGLFAEDPLLQAVLPYKHILYESDLYLVHWGKAGASINQLDKRVPYLEIARL